VWNNQHKTVLYAHKEETLSYPSIYKHVENHGVTLATATDEQLECSFIGAFKEDLPLGFAKVEELVTQLKESDGERVMLSLDPTSEEGKQYARLLGADVSRQVLERHFGVALGFYNCCAGVAGSDSTKLALNMREQIQVQHPEFVHC
jgi:hypothetical protein